MRTENDDEKQIIYKHLRRYLLETKNSKRWVVGNRIITIIEKLLFRKKVLLSIDKIEALISLLENKNKDPNHVNKTIPIDNIIACKSIAFICSNDQLDNTTAGDVMTAFELMQAFTIQTGINGFLWDYKNHQFPKSDVLLSLIYHADITQLKGFQKSSLRICWIRNHTENWISAPWFKHFNLIICSSEKIKNFILSISDVPVYVLPIASNPARFENAKAELKYTSDYVFTGNKWNEKRFLETHWDPNVIPKELAIYGSSWSKVPKFNAQARGEVHYDEMAAIYASTKIVIDDTNETTYTWASINSRVFDAIASKKIVLSNNPACKHLFGDDFPIFRTQEELKNLLITYFSDESLYQEQVAHNYKILKEQHCYSHRAHELQKIISKHQFPSFNISIAISVNEASEIFQWGDYHYAKSLQNAFKYFGSVARIKIVKDWNEISADEVVLVIQGLKKYIPKSKDQKILYWLISHPELFNPEDYSLGTKLYIASSSFYNKVKEDIPIPCEYLPQFGDSDIFYPLKEKAKIHDAVFVGNSRNIKREAIQFALTTKTALKIIGKSWEEFVPSKMILKEYIAPEELNGFYQTCKTIVIDHWKDMRDEGFVSNKVFNLGLSKTNFITDEIPDIFETALQKYTTPESFKKSIHLQMNDDSITSLRNEILTAHTHYHRAFHILKDLTKNL